MEVCEANFQWTKWKFCEADFHLCLKGIGGAANTPGALISENTLEVNYLNYQICTEKIENNRVCTF
jgi:hypothetical protein